MILRSETIWCFGCGVEITWAPHIMDHKHFCCSDCAQGIPCDCAEKIELDEEYDGRTTRSSSPY